VVRFCRCVFLCFLFYICWAIEGVGVEESFIDGPGEKILSPEQISELYPPAHRPIRGVLDPSTGQIFLTTVDMMVPGAHGLGYYRSYRPHIVSYSPDNPLQSKKYIKVWRKFSPLHEDWNAYQHWGLLSHHYKGWDMLAHLYLSYEDNFSKAYVQGINGLECVLTTLPSGKGFALPKDTPGCGNLVGHLPSGKHDPRNMVLTREGSISILKMPDGTKRIYRQRSASKKYFLEKEILPNGKVVVYSYQNTDCLLPNFIELKDMKEERIYGRIVLEDEGLEASDSGLRVQYDYSRLQHISSSNLFQLICAVNKAGMTLKFSEEYCFRLLVGVRSQLSLKEIIEYDPWWLLLSKYESAKRSFTCGYENLSKNAGDGLVRVSRLTFPVGDSPSSADAVYLIRYRYSSSERLGGWRTEVECPDGSFIHYEFLPNRLLASIQWLDRSLKLQKQQRLKWTDDHHLSSMEWKDGNGAVLFKRKFRVDRFGNPTLETIHGSIRETDSMDSYTISREFSQDGMNLLLSEITEEGRETRWEYLPNTNLVTKKLIKHLGRTVLREFYFYDSEYNLVKVIFDDGSQEEVSDLSDVNQRTVKEYQLRQRTPYLHMPEWCIEKYLKDGEEKVLKKTYYLYDHCGNVVEEKVYGEDEQNGYTLYRTYNVQGELLTEKNAIGDSVSFQYDDRGRVFEKTMGSHLLKTSFSYDRQSNLVRKEEKGKGIHHIHTYEYDFNNQLIAYCDPHQQRTTYSYDPVTHQVARTTFPSMSPIEGPPKEVSVSATYNILGQMVTHTDGEEHTTSYSRNIYGSPTSITCPDGTRSTYRYAVNGGLVEQTDPDQLTIAYKRDLFGRVTKKTYLGEKGECLAQESFIYNSYHLLKHIDREGNCTEFFYDGAGRKIREKFCDQEKEFFYDSLGFLCNVRCENGDNTLIVHYARDALGRVCAETWSDVKGNVLKKKEFAYHSSGEPIKISSWVHDHKVARSFSYDGLNRVIEKKDSSGNITSQRYHSSPSSSGGNVLAQVTSKKEGVEIEETFDFFGHLVEAKQIDDQGTLLSRQMLFYTPRGELACRMEGRYCDGKWVESQRIKYRYDQKGQLVERIQGWEGGSERVTSYAYTPAGKLKRQIHPDNSFLEYDYHPLGFLRSITSSDGQIHHTFRYNRKGELLGAEDHLSGLSFTRELDPYGRVVRECFSTGLEVTRQYDLLGRKKSLTLKNPYTFIDYQHDPLFLRGVRYFEAESVPKYERNYLSYDWSGHLLSEKIKIKNHSLFLTHQWDRGGRKVATFNPYFQEQLVYDSDDRVVKRVTDGWHTSSYTYDGLSQLTSVQTMGREVEHYRYDSLHNILVKNGEEAVVNSLNELLTLGENAYHYDIHGHLLSKEGPEGRIELTYDPLHRLTSVSTHKHKLSLLYDPLGRRLIKRSERLDGWFGPSTSEEYYLYDHEEEIGMLDKNHVLKQLKILGPPCHHQGTEEPAIMVLQGQGYAPIVDSCGQVNKLIRYDDGRVQESYSYQAFGEEKEAQARSINPWRYSGKRIDPETSLLFFGSRYYDPQMGRWLTVDPAGCLNSLNLYQYALNNPFKYYDPHGEWIVSVVNGLISWLVRTSIKAAKVVVGIVLASVIYWISKSSVEKIYAWLGHELYGEGYNQEAVKGKEWRLDPSSRLKDLLLPLFSPRPEPLEKRQHKDELDEKILEEKRKPHFLQRWVNIWKDCLIPPEVGQM